MIFQVFRNFSSPYPFQRIVVFHMETVYFICIANQMTGFYMKCHTWLKWLKSLKLSFVKNYLSQIS